MRSAAANDDLRVFVTDAKHNGALGGLLAADRLCSDAATAANLSPPGTWVAWLSTSDGIASDRVVAPARGRAFRRLDGLRVVNQAEDLIVSDALVNPISVTEKVQPVPLNDDGVWTGTSPTGNLYCFEVTPL